MKLFCLALLFLIVISVESFHEGRFNHGGWGGGWGGWGGYGGYNRYNRYNRYNEYGGWNNYLYGRYAKRQGNQFLKNKEHYYNLLYSSKVSQDGITCTHNSLTKLLACKGLALLLKI